jgi:hypothetical protein
MVGRKTEREQQIILEFAHRNEVAPDCGHKRCVPLNFLFETGDVVEIGTSRIDIRH